MAFLLLLAGGTIAAAAQAVPCTSDWDCSLNGICTAGACVCDAGWTTLPHGVNNAMLPGCGYLDFLPANTSACGPACAFHGGVNDNTSTSSWGGSVIELNSSNGTREFWMYAAEFANHCDLGAWGTNSQVVAAVSSAPTGPFIRQNVAVPTWSHNPEVIRAPDGTLIIFTLGSGKPNGALQNCSGSTGSVYMHGVASATSSIPSVGLKYSRSGRRSHVPANFTLHSSRSPLGPWAATTVQIEGWNASWNLGNWNPAPVMLPDGSVRVMAHTSYVGWSGEVILEAPSWKGPYKVVGSDLIDHCEYCEEGTSHIIMPSIASRVCIASLSVGLTRCCTLTRSIHVAGYPRELARALPPDVRRRRAARSELG